MALCYEINKSLTREAVEEDNAVVGWQPFSSCCAKTQRAFNIPCFGPVCQIVRFSSQYTSSNKHNLHLRYQKRNEKHSKLFQIKCFILIAWVAINHPSLCPWGFYMTSLAWQKYANELTVIWNHHWLIINCNSRMHFSSLGVTDVTSEVALLSIRLCILTPFKLQNACRVKHKATKRHSMNVFQKISPCSWRD